jgi:Tol biopolymer transport system component
MPLSVGDKLGLFEIRAPIGAGGMGEVYRARDTKLGRDVAIKILPENFAKDPERMARFEREAKVLASLNHPNIAHIYGVEDRALVMELVEGESPKGQMPFDEAWKVASQIADALEYAHEHGVVHRDLKPANVKVTPDGVVKLLDFGLAKALSDTPDSPSGDPVNSPTMTLGATTVGTIMGTAAYMSPEQAKGKRVDKRADIWSWGVMLYELLTGERMFKGDDAADTLAHVLTQSPDLTRVPAKLHKLLGRCLEKDPKRRLRDIGDARDLVEILDTTVVAHASRWPWVITAMLGIALIGLAAVNLLWAPWRSTLDPRKIVRFQIAPPDQVTVASSFAMSPDGSKLVYDAASSDGAGRVWLRSMDTLESRPLPGTELPNGLPMFWSFDSRFVFLAMTEKVEKVDVTGGPPITLCDASSMVAGGTGNRDGVILFGLNPGVIQRVALSGGAPSAVTALNAARSDRSHSFPVFLPDGRHFLYLVRTTGSEANGIYLGSIYSRPEQQDPKRLIATDFSADFVAFPDSDRGAILFLRDGTMLAQLFDLRRLETVGEVTPLAEQVGSNRGFGFFSASVNGTLVYRRMRVGDERLGWLDRQGNRLGTVGEAYRYTQVAISPDGTRAAAGRFGLGADIWLTEFAHAGDTRFTFDPSVDRDPVWSPDGSRIAFTSNRSGQYDLYQHASNSSGQDELLFKSGHMKLATDWSRDGRYLLYNDLDPKTKRDLWVLPMDAASSGRKPVAFLSTDFDELNGKFSPDSHWVAYQSDESGRYEIYVRPFPAVQGGGKWPLSHGGGRQPHWRGDGQELFYIGPDNSLMAVPVSASSATFQPGTPKALFKVPSSQTWDVTADGKRFLFPIPSGDTAQNPFTVILNWPSLLKR